MAKKADSPSAPETQTKPEQAEQLNQGKKSIEAIATRNPQLMNLVANTDVGKPMFNIISMSAGNKEDIYNYISEPSKKETPKAKIKKRLDGYPYVEGSFMAAEFKRFAPLYEYIGQPVVDIYVELAFIKATVLLRDRTTGNTECGVGGSDIKIKAASRRDFEEGKKTRLTFLDIVDLSNDVKAAVEDARKNAEREFGITADVFGRQEGMPTEDEQALFDHYMQIYNLTDRETMKERWNKLGANFSKFLERIYEKHHEKIDALDGKSGEVTEAPEQFEPEHSFDQPGVPKQTAQKQTAQEVTYIEEPITMEVSDKAPEVIREEVGDIPDEEPKDSPLIEAITVELDAVEIPATTQPKNDTVEKLKKQAREELAQNMPKGTTAKPAEELDFSVVDSVHPLTKSGNPDLLNLERQINQSLSKSPTKAAEKSKSTAAKGSTAIEINF